MKNFIFLICFAIVVMLGCESETPSSSTSNNSNDTGTVIGFMQTYGIFGELLANQSGTKVTLEGTNYSAITDSIGKWVLHGIPEGSYIATSTRDGYVPKKMYNVTVFGGGTYVYIPYAQGYSTLYPQPEFLFAKEIVLRQFEDYQYVTYHDSSYVDGSGETRHFYVPDTVVLKNEYAIFTMKVGLPKITQGNTQNVMSFHVHLFSSRSPTIDPFNKSGDLYDINTYSTNIYHVYEGRDTTVDIWISNSTLKKAGFKTDETLYVSGYMVPWYLHEYNYNLLNPSYEPDVCSKNCTP